MMMEVSTDLILSRIPFSVTQSFRSFVGHHNSTSSFDVIL
jgi:hypothetical protein